MWGFGEAAGLGGPWLLGGQMSLVLHRKAKGEATIQNGTQSSL